MSADQEPEYYFEPLGEQHNRAAFSCGVESLDQYFQGDPIRQDVSRRVTNAFVLHRRHLDFVRQWKSQIAKVIPPAHAGASA